MIAVPTAPASALRTGHSLGEATVACIGTRYLLSCLTLVPLFHFQDREDRGIVAKSCLQNAHMLVGSVPAYLSLLLTRLYSADLTGILTRAPAVGGSMDLEHTELLLVARCTTSIAYLLMILCECCNVNAVM